jgi:hypothetical protein
MLPSINDGIKFNLNDIYNCHHYYETQQIRTFGTLKIIFIIIK